MVNDLGLYVGCEELQRILGVAQTKAYEIIRNLNKELAEKGYITVAGRVPKKYLLEKLYFDPEELENFLSEDKK